MKRIFAQHSQYGKVEILAYDTIYDSDTWVLVGLDMPRGHSDYGILNELQIISDVETIYNYASKSKLYWVDPDDLIYPDSKIIDVVSKENEEPKQSTTKLLRQKGFVKIDQTV